MSAGGRRIIQGVVMLAALSIASMVSAQNAAPVVASTPERLTQARSLIQTGDADGAQAAYELLAPLEAAQSTNAEFNYLLGVAALESGKPDEAVFALQRAVAGDPRFAGARLELARAYYAAGDNEDARREFEIVSTQNPPPAAVVVIQRYQDAIDRRARRYRSGWSGNLAAGGGYDSNANGGTSDSTFLGFVLNQDSRESESGYYGAQAGIGYAVPITPTVRWRLGGDIAHREYPDAEFVTQTSGGVRTGLVWEGATWQFSSDISGNALLLDGDDNREILALDLAGHRQTSAGTALIGSLRAATLRYDEALEIQDVDQYVGGLSLQWRPSLARRWQFQIGPLGGREEEKKSSSPFGRDILGGRFNSTLLLRGWLWQATLAYLESDYDGEFFGESRKDEQLSLQLHVDVPRLFGEWTLRPAVTLVDNQSDVALYDYDRVEAGLSLQRRW